jgi:hypothetical protein
MNEHQNLSNIVKGYLDALCIDSSVFLNLEDRVTETVEKWFIAENGRRTSGDNWKGVVAFVIYSMISELDSSMNISYICKAIGIQKKSFYTGRKRFLVSIK